MTLGDPLYIDHGRLDFHVGGITSGFAYDKISSWKVGFKFTGPSVEGTQERVSRPLSLAEKIKVLIEHLKNDPSVATGRPTNSREANSPGASHDVRLERCRVVRIDIPSAQPLTLWISERTEDNATHCLLLLANYAKVDEGGYRGRSAYSSWLALIEEGYGVRRACEGADVGPFAELRRQKEALSPEAVEAEVSELIVIRADEWGARQRQRFESTVLAARRRGLIEAEAELREERLQEKFSRDPIGLLGRLGAQIGARQAGETLYRIRVVMNDPVNRESVVTIGYPIFILGR